MLELLSLFAFPFHFLGSSVAVKVNFLKFHFNR